MPYRCPYSTSTRFLRGNLHAHTCCGRFMDLADSGRIYAALGYDFLAVTDHNRTHHPGQVAHWQGQAGLVVVPGEENGATDHIIELGVHDVAEAPPAEAGRNYGERARVLRDAGGFVYGCHPQEYPHGEANIRAGADALHGLEIFNGLREGRGCDEMRNISLWDELLTDGARLWGVAADDFHCQYVSPGHGWVMVQVDEDAEVTWQLIVDQLKAGAFYASTYPSFRRIALDDGLLSVEADGRTQAVQVVGPGGEVLERVEGHKLSWRVAGNASYFRVEAVSGVKRAWSQPFFRET